MRLSSIKGDSGYKSNAQLSRYRVFFNGIEQFDCEIADEERGMIKRIRRVRNPLTRQIQTFRKDPEFGVVKIKEKVTI
jgi:hypothetical protein